MNNVIEITADTIRYAEETLDAQYSHIRKEKAGIPRNRQEAYYNGMRDMLEILVTNGYTDNAVKIQRGAWCNHCVFRRVGE